MELKFMMFAQYAGIGADDKLTIAGVVDTFQVRTPAPNPIRLPGLYLVAGLEATLTDDGLRHTGKLRLVNGSGDEVRVQELGDLPFSLTKDGRPMSLKIVLQFPVMVFPGSDDYVYEFLVDDVRIGSTTFYVTEVTEPPPEPSI
jgi:hypothetical protein